MNKHPLLMIPGPTNVDPHVLRMMAKPVTSHLNSCFIKTFKKTPENVGKIFSRKEGHVLLHILEIRAKRDEI